MDIQTTDHRHGDGPERPVRRRDLLQYVGALGFGAAIAACGSDAGSESAATTDGSASTAAPSSTAADSSAPPDTAVAPAAPVETEVVTTVAETPSAISAWAVGGTDLISVDDPTDDVFDAGGTCALALSSALTEGPCYYSVDVGEDISAGRTGLPMQLCLRLVDADCRPVADHLVEIWHADTRGLYSGDTSGSDDADRFRGDFCTSGDDDADSNTFFRGELTSDSSGRVNFRTCFPGWYATRTLHFHVAVSDPSGERRIVSQMCFTDEFVTEITTGHELYADRGDQDTPLAAASDRFFPARGFDEFVLTTQQNPDGTLLAYHTIMLT